MGQAQHLDFIKRTWLILLVDIILLTTEETPLKDIDQLIQPINAKIRMRMLAEMDIPFIH